MSTERGTSAMSIQSGTADGATCDPMMAVDAFCLNNTDCDIWSLPPLSASSVLQQGLLGNAFNLPPYDFASPQGPKAAGLSDTRSANPRKRRGRAYTGCLTCRERKIKCDESRPVCNNCERSRYYICRGFVNASGVVSYEQNEAYHVRKRPRTEPTPVPQSPFLRAQSQHQRHRHRAALGESAGDEGSHNSAFAESIEGELARDEEETPSISDGIHLLSKSPGVAQEDLSPTLSNADKLDRNPAAAVVSSKHTVDELLEHYRNVVCHVMMPTIEPARNPYLQLYLPLALNEPPTTAQQALKLALLSVSAHHRAQILGEIAASYREMATSYKQDAAHLLRKALDEYGADSETSEKCALLAAALTLVTVDVFSGDEGDWLRNLNLSRRVIQKTGGERFWKSNLQANLLYQNYCCYEMVASTTGLRSRDGDGDGDNNAGNVNQREQDGEHVTSSNNSSRRSSSSSSNSDDNDDDNDDDDNLHQGREEQISSTRGDNFASTDEQPHDFSYPDHYILDISFGISLRTISLLNRVIHLASTCAKYANSASLPDALVDAINVLESDLHTVNETPSAFSSPHPRSSLIKLGLQPGGGGGGGGGSNRTTESLTELLHPVVAEELLENHQWAFHYAVILFFYRAIRALRHHQQHGANSCSNTTFTTSTHNRARFHPREDGQKYVEKVLERLENIDCLTRGTEIRPANTLWPAVVAGCEAIDVPLRHRVLIYFSRASKRGIGNVPRAKQLVMEVWRRVDRYYDDESVMRWGGLGPIDWRAVMQEVGPSIMLT
ncbi:hypothetical protein VTO42DRAFT_6041 [Malbranchea cinnamomea]